MNYNLYLPTETQIVPVSTLELSDMVSSIVNGEVTDKKRSFSKDVNNFILDQNVGLTESNCIQFKQLKAQRSKTVSIADRITNESNKLERYISGFANNSGGQIYFGITDNGTIKGELLESRDQDEIVKKVTKTFNRMFWHGGKLERGRHWNIQFEPVQDEYKKRIPALFVVVVWVSSLRGGLFTKEPESYKVVQGRVERIPFSDWRGRILGSLDEVPSGVGRLQWSSVKAQKTYYKVTEQLVIFQNNGDWSGFNSFAKWAEKKYPDSAVRLTILAEKSVLAYKTGAIHKAERLHAQYEKELKSSHLPDVEFFQLRGVYARSAIARAKGDYQESDNIARDGLQLAETVPHAICVAWFYCHVAMLQTILSKRTQVEEDTTRFVNSAQDYYAKAYQHAQGSSVEKEFSVTVADFFQRMHILRAISQLGDIVSGGNVDEIKESDIEAAKKDLRTNSAVLLEGHLETKFRRIHCLFAMSDLSLSQWRQEQQQQQRTEVETSAEDYKTPRLLKVAFAHAKNALNLANGCHFRENVCYALKRLGSLTEIMIRQNVSTSLLARNAKFD